MKKILTYTILALTLAACSQDSPKAPDSGDDDQYLMKFLPVTIPMSRDAIAGVYTSQTYPVNNLYLTAFLKDNYNQRQYYFTDWKLNYDGNVWTAPNWYWPLQGEMWFLSYYCSGFSKQPSFDTIEDTDGYTLPRMTVTGTGLDGKTDFLYLSHTGVQCPQIGATTLVFEHGLTWITLSLRAEVLKSDGSGEADPSKTSELINNLRINKVVIEDCATEGIATIVPTRGINWKTYDDSGSTPVSFVKDQVYYSNAPAVTSLSGFSWTPMPDGSTFDTGSNYFKLSNTAQHLGVYGTDTESYCYNGLLIVPQSKTAITIDYTVTKPGTAEPIHKVERYELRDNSQSWLPGYHYDYNIVFRNYQDYADNFEVIENWEGVATQDDGNLCYETSWAGMYFYKYFESNLPMVVPEPMHDGGSATGDDMDYEEGKRVF